MTDSSPSRRITPSLVAALLALTAPVAASRAQVTPNGDDFQANSYTTSYQTFPSVAVDPAGGFVAAWASFGSAEPTPAISASRRGASTPTGVAARWDDFQVNVFTNLPAVPLRRRGGRGRQLRGDLDEFGSSGSDSDG